MKLKTPKFKLYPFPFPLHPIKKLFPFALLILLFAGSIIAYSLYHPTNSEAAWFNENWGFRKAITITNNSGGIQPNLQFLIIFDTSTLISAGQLQSACQDLRFTNQAGDSLPYYIDSGCNSSTTKIWVLIDSLPQPSGTIYAYYGNPGAIAGSDSTQFDNMVGLQGYWTMNQSSGTSVTDSSINGNTGTFINTPTWNTTGCQYVYCVNFSSTKSISVEDASSLDMASNKLTVETWVFWDGTTTTDGPHMLRKAAAQPNASPWFTYQINMSNTGFANFQVQSSGGAATTTATSSQAITTNTWTHVTGTWDGTTATIYINGVSKGTGTGALTVFNSSGKLWLGNDGNGGNPLTGRLDDVKVFNTARTATQVLTDYQTAYTIATTSPSFSTSTASVEKAPQPVAYWKLDDGQGTTAQDATTNNNDGTLTNGPTWQTEDQCVSGKCLSFDGTDDYISSSKIEPTTAITTSAWIYSTDVGAADIDGQRRTVINNFYFSGGPYGYTLDITTQKARFYVGDGSGNPIAATGSTTLTTNKWYFITGTYDGITSRVYINGVLDATSTSGSGIRFNASSVQRIGRNGQISDDEFKGKIDEPKVYNYARSAAQIQADYNSRGNPQGLAGVLGSSFGNNTNALSQGLVGYWKMDESSSTAADSSGNGVTLTNNATTTYTSGKFGNSANFVSASSQYLSTATTLTGAKTIAFWVNPSSTTDEFVNLTATAYVTVSSGIVSATGFTSPSIYVNGVLNGTVTASTWNHIVIITDTAINANAWQVGRANGSYLNGKIDEARVYNRALSSADVTALYNYAPGPVGYYQFDEKTGQTVADSSGNGNSGTLGDTSGSSTDDPSWTQGKYGGALNFDGSSDLVKIPTATSLKLGTSYTVSAWIKTNTITNDGTEQSILAQEYSPDMEFMIDSGSLHAKAYLATDAGWPDYALWGNSPGLRQWTYTTMVVDGVHIKIYQNGKLDTSGDAISTNTTAAGDPFFVGYSGQSGAPHWFNGAIDEVKIYNYPRSSKQIVSDMNAGHPNVGSPVGSALGQWKMDEGADNTCSGGSNDVCNSGSTGTTLDAAKGATTAAPTWTNSGKFGKALSFDGGDYLQITSPSALRSPEVSVSTWIKTNTIDSSGSDIISMGDSYIIRMETNGAISFIIYNGSNWSERATSTAVFNDNAWHHVVGVKNTTLNQVLVYVDGRLAATATSSSAISYTLGSDFFMGKNGNGSTVFDYTGSLDEAKVYNYPLTADEVKIDMNQGKSQQLGSLGNNSTYTNGATNQVYCVPGDATSCAAPIGEWNLDEGSGTTVNDSSGSGATGAWINGTGWTTGKINKGGQTNGIAYVGVGTNTSTYAISGALTWEMWVNPTVLSGSNTYALIAKGGNGGGGNGTFNYDSWFDASTGKVTFLVGSTGGATGTSVTSNSTFSTNTWYHLAFVYSPSTSLTIYINGKRDAQNTTSIPSSIATTSSDVTFGNDGNQHGVLNAKMDQIRAFNSARTLSQVAWDYNKGAPIAQYKMDECQGTTIGDSSGNSLTGTLTVGVSGTQTSAGTCLTSSTAWGNGAIGKYNSSLNFDGTDDYVDMGDASTLEVTNLTISAWVKFSSTAAFYEVAGKYDHTGQDGYKIAIEGTTGKAYFQVGTNAATPFSISSSSVADNNWHLLTGTYDGTNLKLYVDSVLVDTDASAAISYSTEAFLIAKQVAVSPTYFPGKIDDVRIYNYPLTLTQIRQVMNQGAAVRFGPVTGAP